MVFIPGVNPNFPQSIPALQSFAFFGLVMTLAIFAFQLIFFTPCVLIRYRNLSSGRDACFLCITYADASSGGLLAWSPSHLLRSVFYWLGKILTNTIVKVRGWLAAEVVEVLGEYFASRLSRC